MYKRQPLKSSNIDLSRIHCDNLIAKFVNTEILEIDLTDTYECFFKTCKSNGITSPLGFANSKSRMRMILLYQIAATYSGLVVGTGNKVEDFGVGFYTKYGDGGVDVSPIADLTKTEVRLLAEELSIHKDIISAAPSDGLWDDGRTDEQQLGLSYDDIEDAMSNEKSPHREAYISVRNKNIHKMRPIPVCTIEDLSLIHI